MPWEEIQRLWWFALFPQQLITIKKPCQPYVMRIKQRKFRIRRWLMNHRLINWLEIWLLRRISWETVLQNMNKCLRSYQWVWEWMLARWKSTTMQRSSSDSTAWWWISSQWVSNKNCNKKMSGETKFQTWTKLIRIDPIYLTWTKILSWAGGLTTQLTRKWRK